MLKVKILFQGIGNNSSSKSRPNSIIISSKDLKVLGFKPGSIINISDSSNPHITALFQVWSSSDIPVGSGVIHSLWKDYLGGDQKGQYVVKGCSSE